MSARSSRKRKGSGRKTIDNTRTETLIEAHQAALERELMKLSRKLQRLASQCSNAAEDAETLIHRLREYAASGSRAVRRRQILLQQTDSVRRAYAAYKYGVGFISDKKPLERQVYDYLADHRPDLLRSKKGKRVTLDSWCKYVRIARKAIGEQKNTSRKGRVGGSVVLASQL